MTLTPLPLVVVPTMTPTPPMDTTDLGRDRHQGLLTTDMTIVRRQDTGDCSFPPSFLQWGLGQGHTAYDDRIFFPYRFLPANHFFDKISNICW